MANNNYYQGNNTNPGFDTSTVVPGQQGGMSVGQSNGQGFDIVKWLQDAIQQSNTPAQGGTTQGGMSVGSSSQKPQLNPYQEGVAKALKDGGINFTTEALQQGVPADHIIEQAGLSPNVAAPDPSKTALLQSLLNPSPQQGSFNVSGGQPTESDMQGNVRQNVLQGLIKSTQQPQGVLAGFLHGFAQGTGYTKGNLENLNSAATAAGLAQEQAGEKPIQPTDIAKMNRETFANTVTGYKSQLENNQKQYNELNTQLKTLEENRNPAQKTMGWMSPDQIAILDQMKAVQLQNIEHLNGLKEIMVNAPKQLTENTNQNKFKVKKIGN